jgi:predicted ATP-grasp superfamily ATP-dependent carboligase
VDVLVTGADQRQSLSVIRSLGRHGLNVVAAGPHDRSLGFRSRYAAATWIYPNPYRDARAFIDSIVAAARTFKVDMIFPVVESTLVVINQFRETVEKEAAVVAASKEAVALAQDKDRQARIAARLGIRVPNTIAPASMQEAQEQIRALRFPVVLKANIKPQDEAKAGDIQKVSFAADWSSLSDLLQTYYRNDVLPIIQEMIFGEGIGCGVLMDHDHALCCYQYHRGRENHPTGGVPVRYQSMPLWPEIRDQSIRMLQAMGWHGIAQVEWKNIIGTRDIVLMEVNGRFWASLPGALHAGMDFPAWLYDLWRGRPVHCNTAYRIPMASRYLSGDLNRLEIVLRSPPPISSVPIGSRTRETLAFAGDFFRWRVKSDVFSWGDPGPGFQEIGDIVKHYLNRAAQKVASRRKISMTAS